MPTRTVSGRALLPRIKQIVVALDPTAQVVLYGSYARNEENTDSDIDVLILLEKEHLSFEDKKRIAWPLYHLEIENGTTISPLVLSRSEWHGRFRISPFYHEVQKQGVVL